MVTKTAVQEQRAAEDAALEPLGMTVGSRPKHADGGDLQLKLFSEESGRWTESARELVRTRPLQAVGVALLIGLLLGRLGWISVATNTGSQARSSAIAFGCQQTRDSVDPSGPIQETSCNR